MDADDLYALAPEEFTAARTSAAKAARGEGDREGAAALTALRRPSVAAWLVNLVARRRAELLEQVLSLGPALAEAQASGQGGELRALSEQRRSLVEAVADAAVELADRPVTRAVREEVAATFEAALADPASAAAVRSGRLVRALSYAGFGGVDLADAVAEAPSQAVAPLRKPARGQRDQHRQALAAAEQAALSASGLLDDAVAAAGRAERRAGSATGALADAEREVEAARAALEGAELRRDECAQARGDAEREAAEAVEAVSRAQEAAEQARQALDRLRRSGP